MKERKRERKGKKKNEYKKRRERQIEQNKKEREFYCMIKYPIEEQAKRKAIIKYLIDTSVVKWIVNR